MPTLANFATANDLIKYMKRSLTSDELDLANVLLTNCSSMIRVYAHDRGYDIDEMIEDYAPRADVAKDITCEAVKRAMSRMMQENDSAMSQMSQSAGGYTISGTFINAGSDLFILDNEYKRLGITKQKIRAVVLYET